jgi:G-patch domain
MGWKEGEGLGKNNSGPTAPLELDMKMDRKGDFLLAICSIVCMRKVQSLQTRVLQMLA